MDDEKIVTFAPRLRARVEAAIESSKTVERSAEGFRTVTRAVREMRERGATTKEITHTLRAIADELDGGIR